MKTLTVLGSTGSIGTNTLDVVRHGRHLYQVYALVAGHNVELLASQIVEFHTQIPGVATSQRLERLCDSFAAAGNASSHSAYVCAPTAAEKCGAVG